MNTVELLTDMMDFNANWLRESVKEMSPALMRWQPDPQANNINVILWHIGRILDVFNTRILQGKAQEDELWFAQKWDQKVGYDPRGLGILGLGAVLGYTVAEMKAIPEMDKETLMAYFDLSHEAITTYLRSLPEGGLEELRQGFNSEQSVYAYCRHVFMDVVRHVGEILTIQSMWQRQQTP